MIIFATGSDISVVLSGGANQPASPSKRAAKAFDELTVYKFNTEEFTGGDAVHLRQEDWNEETFSTQALPLLHAIFRMAHGNTLHWTYKTYKLKRLQQTLPLATPRISSHPGRLSQRTNSTNLSTQSIFRQA